MNTMKSSDPRRIENADERGAALVIVLSFLLLLSVLVTSGIAISKITNMISSNAAKMSETAYVAEGAAARFQWLLMDDIRQRPNRGLFAEDPMETFDTIGSQSGDGEDETEQQRIKPGQNYRLNYYGHKVVVKQQNMLSGIDVSNSRAWSNLRKSMGKKYEDLEEFDTFLEFIDCVKDYEDRDDFNEPNGFEAGDYDSEGIPNLPRNGPLQFREEMLWIRGANEYVKPGGNGRLDQFMIVPPEGMRVPNNDMFTGANDINNYMDTQYLMDNYQYDATTAADVARKISSYLNGQIPLDELETSLDPEIWTAISGIKESPYYTFTIKVDEDVKKTLQMSLEVKSSMRGDNQYYEWIQY